jgi:ferredoxin/flavodoxin
MQFFIVYFSPAGTTAYVARIIRDELAGTGEACSLVNLGDAANSFASGSLPAEPQDICLCIGSPVYAGHAVPVVMDFIAGLPKGINCCSMLFVTWGAVTSGVALYEMARALEEKGYPVCAAAKIVAEHSLLRQSEKPLGKGRPDAADDDMIRKMVQRVVVSLNGAGKNFVPAAALNYQSEALQKIFAGLSIGAARKVLPQITVQAELCTRCGVCVAACPVEAIELGEKPVFNERCIACYNCLRACPEQALQADFSRMQAGLEQRKNDFGETCETKVYLP